MCDAFYPNKCDFLVTIKRDVFVFYSVARYHWPKPQHEEHRGVGDDAALGQCRSGVERCVVQEHPLQLHRRSSARRDALHEVEHVISGAVSVDDDVGTFQTLTDR